MLPQDIVNKYETQHLRNQRQTETVISSLWDDFIREAAILLSRNLPKAILNQQLNKILRDLSNNQTLTIQTGIQQAWQISNEKTFAFLDKRLQGVQLPDSLQATFYDPNLDALQKFQERKVAGLDLSQRVWKHTKRAQQIINDTVEKGIGTGESAASIARKVRSSLISDVTLPSPGKGIYRSPVKNSQRLTRTETNMAYRKADDEAWASNPIILGYKIQLSKSGKPKIRCEICKSLEGIYPVDFKWVGWHISCLCFKTPILMNRQQMDKYIALIASGQDSASAVEAIRIEAGLVKSVPPQFSNHLRLNYEKMMGWKSMPLWVKDNQKVVNSIVK